MITESKIRKVLDKLYKVTEEVRSLRSSGISEIEDLRVSIQNVEKRYDLEIVTDALEEAEKTINDAYKTIEEILPNASMIYNS